MGTFVRVSSTLRSFNTFPGGVLRCLIHSKKLNDKTYLSRGKLQIIQACRHISCSQVLESKKDETPLYHETKGKLIYEGTIHRKVWICKFLSLNTCTIGLSGQIYLFLNSSQFSTALLTIGVTSLGFFTFVTTAIIHSVTKRYLRDIYYNPSTKLFTSSRYSFFLQKKEFQYSVKDVKVLELPGMFSTLQIKGKPFMINDDNITDYDAYIQMIGYDKPLNLRNEEKLEMKS